jgi:hypothetical protein
VSAALETIDALRARLLENDFTAVRDEKLGRFDDRLIELVREPVRVLLQLERGVVAVIVEHTELDASHDIELWDACMTGRNPELVLPAAAEQVERIIETWDRFSGLPRRHPDIATCLEEAGIWRFGRRRAEGLITGPFSDD